MKDMAHPRWLNDDGTVNDMTRRWDPREVAYRLAEAVVLALCIGVIAYAFLFYGVPQP